MDYENVLMALKNGNVPEKGVKNLCIGREKEIDEFEKLLDKVNNKKAIVKFINGEFGAGKSFFLKVIEEMAYDKNFVVSWITLSNNLPFRLYQSIVLRPLGRLHRVQHHDISHREVQSGGKSIVPRPD